MIRSLRDHLLLSAPQLLLAAMYAIHPPAPQLSFNLLEQENEDSLVELVEQLLLSEEEGKKKKMGVMAELYTMQSIISK